MISYNATNMFKAIQDLNKLKVERGDKSEDDEWETEIKEAT